MTKDLADETWERLTPDEKERLTAFAAHRMRPALMKAIAETGAAYFDVGEMFDPFTGEPLPQEGAYETPEAVGYVCDVDREARTVRVSSERVSSEQVEEAIGDLDVPFLLYHFAVRNGAQRPVAEIWPELRGTRIAASSVSRLAEHFYASKPPDSVNFA